MDAEQRDDGARREKESDNDPPFSRIFVVCPKDSTEEELQSLFQTCGKIQYCKVIRDRTSGESKGFAYIKFALASAAAVSIELFDGQKLTDESAPLKVMIAEAKGTQHTHSSQKQVSKDPEDNPPRSRLYVVCPKTVTDEEMEDYFRPYGELEYSRLLRTRDTKESKGCAYIKYTLSSSAMKAIEGIQADANLRTKLRIVVAEPKARQGSPGLPTGPLISSYARGPVPAMQYVPMQAMAGGVNPLNRDHLLGQLAMLTKGLIDQYAPGQAPVHLQQFSQQLSAGPMPTGQMMMGAAGGAEPRLYVVCPKSISQEALGRLFSRFPGLEYLDLKHDRLTGESKGFAFVGFQTVNAAMMARQALDGIEFPVGSGHNLKVVFAEPPRSNNRDPAHPDNMDGQVDAQGQQQQQQQQQQQMQQQQMPQSPLVSHSGQRNPVPQPPANADASRLFAVLTRPVPQEDMLWEIFNQFPGLEYVRLQQGKNYGYVKYGTPAAATHALYYLDGAEVTNGSRITLKVADPPPPRPTSAGDADGSIKRQRIHQ